MEIEGYKELGRKEIGEIREQERIAYLVDLTKIKWIYYKELYEKY